VPSSPRDQATADVLLADGTVAVVRLLEPSDGAALHALHDNVSDDNLRLRFFAVGRTAAHQYVDHLLRDESLAMVVEQHGRVIALATAETVAPGTAEVAFLVEDGRHGQGIGSLLLEHLAAVARSRGIEVFTAEVLTENHAMLGVFSDAGFTMSRHVEEGIVTVRLDTRSTDTSRAAADARERRAEARSLQPLLYPRSVAVVGVRSDGAGVGRSVFDAIRNGGFTGSLYAVHPRSIRIGETRAFASFADLPETVDLVVVAVPAHSVVTALEGAADAGVRAAVVLSSGFQELGERGAELQHDLSLLARRRSIRVVGPNCLGVLSNHPDINLNATFSGCLPPPGGLAVATQSGGVGIVLEDLAEDLGLGIGSLISLGNKADVSGNDLLAAWTDDPRVTGAALYLESFGNAPKFARIARRFAERKPLLAVVGGRSAGGQRAGASHTAAAATPAVGVAALFAQAGVVGCDGADDLAETALVLTREPLPKGPRLGVVTNAGGMGVLAADAAAEHGLTVPELSAEARERVARHVVGTSGTSNPIDAGAAVASEELAAAVEEVMVSGEVDAVVVLVVETSLSDTSAVLGLLAEVRRRRPEVTLVVVPQGRGHRPPDPEGATCLRSPTAAVRAIGRAAHYSAWLAEQTAEAVIEAAPHEQLTAPLADLLRRRELAARLLATEAAGGGWVGAASAARLLSDYGLGPVGGIASGPDAVADLSATVGFPVVIKVAGHDVVHRTERGLVRVGLGSAEDVHAAVTSFEREMGHDDVPVLVQPMVSGVELAIGVVRDPAFGPLVMVGAGGVTTDLLGDRVYLLPPVHRADARRALRGLRTWPLLEGFRGSAPVDVDAVVDLVVAVGRLVQEVPEVAEVDLNPVMVSPTGCSLVDVKLRLAPMQGHPAEAPRQLRRTT
jgi:acyl-CoA synthetase (NDP forming)/GNAT superfamily N-acetyltransferase